MDFDLRLPLGLIFSLFGAMLTLFGLFSDPALYARSLGINVNLIWGIVMGVFGVFMLIEIDGGNPSVGIVIGVEDLGANAIDQEGMTFRVEIGGLRYISTFVVTRGPAREAHFGEHEHDRLAIGAEIALLDIIAAFVVAPRDARDALLGERGLAINAEIRLLHAVSAFIVATIVHVLQPEGNLQLFWRVRAGAAFARPGWRSAGSCVEPSRTLRPAPRSATISMSWILGIGVGGVVVVAVWAIPVIRPAHAY